MSFTPPPPPPHFPPFAAPSPLQDGLPQAPSRAAGVRVWICWIVILGSMAAMIATVVRGKQLTAAAGIDADAGIQLEITCRYFVGCKQLFQGTQMPPNMLKDVFAMAKSPLDQVRIIPVIGALQDDAHAASEAQKLLDSPLSAPLRRDATLLDRLYTLGPNSISQSGRQSLIARHGWFGKLAAAHGLGPADPLRQAVDRMALRTVVVSLTALVLFGVFLLVGLVLMTRMLIRFISGQIPPHYHPADSDISDVMLEGFALWMVLLAAIETAVHLLPQPAGPAWNLLICVPFAAAMLWVRVRGITWSHFGQAAGWRRGEGFLREAAAGITTYIAAMPMLAVAAAASALLTSVSGTSASHPIVRGVYASGAVQLLLVFLACIFAPITEEMLFRGMLLGHLRRRHRWLLSALLVSLIFASIHPQGWTTIPVLGAIAMVLATLREHRDSLIGPMTAHALNNGLVLALLFLIVG